MSERRLSQAEATIRYMLGRQNRLFGSVTSIGLLSAEYTAGASLSTTAAQVLVWDTPELNQDSWTYSSGVFTVPETLNGAYLEFDLWVVTTSTASSETEIEVKLEIDTGSGYTTVAKANNYATRNLAQDTGGTAIPGYVHPTAAAAGDNWRVTVRGYGDASTLQSQSHISIKSYQ